MDLDKMMHYKDLRSGQLVNGIERSAHRALLYSTGLDTDDLKKPMIAVVNSFTEMVPGHIHLKELAEYVKQGIYLRTHLYNNPLLIPASIATDLMDVPARTLETSSSRSSGLYSLF